MPFVQCQPSQSSEPVTPSGGPAAERPKRESGIRRRQSKPQPAKAAAPPPESPPKRGRGRPRKVPAAAPRAVPPAPAKEQPKPPVKAKPRPRPVNYRSASSPATVRKQLAIRELLTSAAAGEGVTVRQIAEQLHISRQLALYHVKKLVALGGCVALLGASPENGGVRYLVWDQVRLAEFYIDWLDRSTAPATKEAA